MSSPVFERWVRGLAEHLDATVRPTRRGFRLRSSSDRWNRFTEIDHPDPESCLAALVWNPRSVLVSESPRSLRDWRVRLWFVEKAAARALSASPVGFYWRPEGGGDARRSRSAVRLAFGLSCSYGASLRQRFTAYFDGRRRAWWQWGEDSLFDLAGEIAPLDPDSAVLREGLPKVLAKVKEAQEAFCGSDPVVAEMERLRSCLRREVRSLERLYMANSGQYARLLGQASNKELKGDDAIEAEYLNRLEQLLERYQPRLVFEPISLGVLEWPATVGSPAQLPPGLDAVEA